MRRDAWFGSALRHLKSFSLAALAGLALGLAGLVLDAPQIALPGALLILPLVLLIAFLPLVHWKERYVGEKSSLWGFLLAFEVSGWFKIIYWVRHVIPDLRSRGRYEGAL